MNTDILTREKAEQLINSKCGGMDRIVFTHVYYSSSTPWIIKIAYLVVAALIAFGILCDAAFANILLHPEQYLTTSTAQFVLQQLIFTGIRITIEVLLVLRCIELIKCRRFPFYYGITESRLIKVAPGFLMKGHTIVYMDWGGFSKAFCPDFNGGGHVLLSPESEEQAYIKINANSPEEAYKLAESINAAIEKYKSLSNERRD